jgi:hypothetical protein
MYWDSEKKKLINKHPNLARLKYNPQESFPFDSSPIWGADDMLVAKAPDTLLRGHANDSDLLIQAEHVIEVPF